VALPVDFLAAFLAVAIVGLAWRGFRAAHVAGQLFGPTALAVSADGVCIAMPGCLVLLNGDGQLIDSQDTGDALSWPVADLAFAANDALQVAFGRDGRLCRWDLRQRCRAEANTSGLREERLDATALIGPDGNPLELPGARRPVVIKRFGTGLLVLDPDAIGAWQVDAQGRVSLFGDASFRRLLEDARARRDAAERQLLLLRRALTLAILAAFALAFLANTAA
jgi:hypothetical protein